MREFNLMFGSSIGMGKKYPEYLSWLSRREVFRCVWYLGEGLQKRIEG